MNDDKNKIESQQPAKAEQPEAPKSPERRGIKVLETLKPTGESESSAESEYFGEVPVLRQEATQQKITEQLRQLEGHEAGQAEEITQEKDLDAIKDTAQAVISETSRQASVAAELAAFLDEYGAETLLIDPTRYVENLRDIPEAGLKFLITERAGKKFQQKFQATYNFHQLSTSDDKEAGFSVINTATGLPEYVFIYSLDK